MPPQMLAAALTQRELVELKAYYRIRQRKVEKESGAGNENPEAQLTDWLGKYGKNHGLV